MNNSLNRRAKLCAACCVALLLGSACGASSDGGDNSSGIGGGFNLTGGVGSRFVTGAGGSGTTVNTSLGGGANSTTKLPNAQDTVDGLQAVSTDVATSLQKNGCSGGQSTPQGGGAILEFVIDISGSMSSESTDLGASLTTTLSQIASSALSCTYSVPPPSGSGQTIDPSQTVLVYTDGATGQPYIVLQNTSATCDKGWHYTDATNSKIEICGTTCAEIQGSSASTLSASFGCNVAQIIL